MSNTTKEEYSADSSEKAIRMPRLTREGHLNIILSRIASLLCGLNHASQLNNLAFFFPQFFFP